MRVLLVHNKYQYLGGEDKVFSEEADLLKRNDHVVDQLIFDNNELNSTLKKVKAGLQMAYNKSSGLILENRIKSFKPDIIHVHNIFYLVSPSILYVAKKYSIPVVVTLHNYRLICSGALLLRNASTCEICIGKILPFSGIKYKCHRNSTLQTTQLTLVTSMHKLLGTWKRKVDTFVTMTEFTKRKFVESSLKLDPNKIVVKPNSVDDLGYSDPNDRENYFLFVGRLSKEKGIDILLKATEVGNFKLEIIGDGPMEDDVRKYINSNSNIVYHGYQDRDFIKQKLKSSLALVFPSISYEGLPITILEAFSTGTPVISSDIGNINQIVENQINGIHFRTSDFKDLGQKIGNFISENQKFRHLYENARATYIKKYTPEINYRNLINIYGRLT
ncbi:glycosyltransferase family 4 protein [Fulvivirgaceae bacterium BMA10]|uniref:Glycosyltransferase family 4 protein n=1 Tax=Splendidivirga corallicola TaxID=3051826 RepID=A0ABT8KLN2_9BACT|nr:glycosyltransferase family 4 protein [Fulvivirgaceae bacterium BMA10]